MTVPELLSISTKNKTTADSKCALSKTPTSYRTLLRISYCFFRKASQCIDHCHNSEPVLPLMEGYTCSYKKVVYELPVLVAVNWMLYL